MYEENANISSKTWSRSVEPIVKAGYMDGASDGQTTTFQSSFNIGYMQGLKFGLQIGFNQGLSREQNQVNITEAFRDSRRINCQLCVNGTMMEEKIDNIYNIQEECNGSYLQIVQKSRQNDNT